MNSMTVHTAPQITAEETPPSSNLPAAFSWNDSSDVAAKLPGSTVTISPVMNQGSCGSCWACGSTQMMADRWAIAKKRAAPLLNVGQTVACSQDTNGCNGGGPGPAFELFASDGVQVLAPTCHAYDPQWTEATLPSCGASTGTPCAQPGVEPVKAVSGSMRSLSGTISDMATTVPAMKASIYAHGPIVAALWAYSDLMSGQFANDIYIHDPATEGDTPPGGHVVVVVGWGESGGIPYWVVRNSWGTGWGNGGYFNFAMSTAEGRNEGVGLDHSATDPQGNDLGGSLMWYADTSSGGALGESSILFIAGVCLLLAAAVAAGFGWSATVRGKPSDVTWRSFVTKVPKWKLLAGLAVAGAAAGGLVLSIVGADGMAVTVDGIADPTTGGSGS